MKGKEQNDEGILKKVATSEAPGPLVKELV